MSVFKLEIEFYFSSFRIICFYFDQFLYRVTTPEIYFQDLLHLANIQDSLHIHLNEIFYIAFLVICRYGADADYKTNYWASA